MDALEWLETWFAKHCDREWEQTRGVSITTLDNPGWLVTVDLVGTSLESRPASPAVIAIDGEPPSAETETSAARPG